MRTAFIGSVILSKIALQTILEFGIEVNIIFSLDESVSENVSDYFPLHEYAEQNNIQYKKFIKVNDIANDIENGNIDYLFVVGLSQIIPEQILSSIKKYSIGFHPTALPKYRGRAPIPWMILLGVRDPMVTIFKLDKGVDSGDIIIQEPYFIECDDYANDVYLKVGNALKNGLLKCLPSIYGGNACFAKQNDALATYLLKRIPIDGEINWSTMSGQKIYDLVRAVSFPYPGAYTTYNGSVVKICKAYLRPNLHYFGQNGQIAMIEHGEIFVITNDSQLLVIQKYEFQSEKQSKFSIGGRFR